VTTDELRRTDAAMLGMPDEWGRPPADGDERRRWLLDRIAGRPVPVRTATEELIAEADEALGRFDDGERTRSGAGVAPSVRDAGAVVAARLTGLAVPFGSLSQPLALEGFVERFDAAAFADQMRSRFAGVFALWSHMWAEPIGRVPGTLTVDAARDGLRFDLSPVGERGRDAAELVREGVVGGVSVGFRPLALRWEADPVRVDGKDWPLVTVTRAEVRELSLVARPAYRATTVQARDLAPSLPLAPAARARRRRRLTDGTPVDHARRDLMRRELEGRRRAA
jgi:HK97 family phage prohead protease